MLLFVLNQLLILIPKKVKADVIYTFKLGDVLFNPRCYYNTDNNSNPTIASVNLDGVISTNFSTFALTLQPQTIQRITLYINDNIDPLLSVAGVGNNYIFSVALVIEEYDLLYNEISNTTGEARKDFINAEKNSRIK